MQTQKHYRPDIDGLRAVAVLAVVLYHLDERFVPGGFTGVDIFFVISGYLITSILKREIEAGQFSFGDFYLRRARRIGPAYFAVTLATLLAGAALLTATDFTALSRSALWSAAAMPNVYFWRSLDTGYFAAASNQIPLLHLWSLGVEEQFYLFWPILLLVGLRRTGHAVVAGLLVATSIGSFMFAQHIVASDPSFAYYMLPARAGELGIGALLVLLPTDSHIPRLAREAIGLTGYLLLAAALFMLDGDSTFPGWNALLPCAGAAMLILAGRARCTVNALLRLRPVVWIGLISYSLYLWHWPVLAFIRYFRPTLDPALILAASVGMLTLAVCSYYLIERPCRRMRFGRQWHPALFFYALPLAGVIAVCVAAPRLKLVEGAQPLQTRLAQARLREYTAPAFEYDYNCQLGRVFDPKVLDKAACVHGGPVTGPIRAILWGDSHAAHYIGIVASIAEKKGFRVRNASVSTCPPVLSSRMNYGEIKYRDACTQFRSLMKSKIDDFDIVFMGAVWSAAFRKYDSFDKDFRTTLKFLSQRGKTVVLLGQVPQFPLYDRECEMKNINHRIVDCKRQAEYPFRGIGKQNRRLRRLADQYPNVYYLDVSRIICRDGTCSPYLDGRPVYYDHSHLSMAGSWVVGRHVLERPATIRMLNAPLRKYAEN